MGARMRSVTRLYHHFDASAIDAGENLKLGAILLPRPARRSLCVRDFATRS